MRFFFKCSCLLSLSCILIFCTNAYAKAPSPAYEKATSPMHLLHEVMKSSANITTLKTQFVQEKHVDFLHAPITSEGHMYFAKQENATYSLLWEYNPPSASGIWFHNDTSWIWTQTRKSLRKALGNENTFVKTMMQQMIFWLQIDPKKIVAHYELVLLAERTITLIPKRKDMFTSITVTFSKNLKSLESLVLDEGKGNSTALTFSKTEYNTQTMRTFPDGTPLP